LFSKLLHPLGENAQCSNSVFCAQLLEKKGCEYPLKLSSVLSGARTQLKYAIRLLRRRKRKCFAPYEHTPFCRTGGVAGGLFESMLLPGASWAEFLTERGRLCWH
jgi:hypothetical protein